MNTSFKLSFLKDTFNQSTFKILYYRNKMYIIPGVVILLALFLFFFAIIPQIQDYFSLRDEEKNIKERIAIAKINYSLLSGVDTGSLDNFVQTAAIALPVEKDFGGILRSIAQAATKANVTLGDFSFQIGQLSSGTTKITNALPIEITLIANSEIIASKRFLQELTNALPLSEVTSIKAGGSTTTMTAVFYYKPFLEIAFNQGSKIQPLSKDEVSLLQKLALFQTAAPPAIKNDESSMILPFE